jgi:hypothetical protein
MKGLKEAVAGIKFTNREEIIALGALGYKMGIEKRNNPRKTEGERKLWDIGYDQASKSFADLLRRNNGDLR